jgi:hypothetical protein
LRKPSFKFLGAILLHPGHGGSHLGNVEYDNTLAVFASPGERDHEEDMSAYVIVEATVLDAESRNRCASEVEPLFREFGAEVIAFGPWQALSGEPAFDNGMIIRFPGQ